MNEEERAEDKQWVITIAIDADAPAVEAQAFMDAIADAVHSFQPRSGWDPHMTAAFIDASLGALGGRQ